jgi:hypothetical protein
MRQRRERHPDGYLQALRICGLDEAAHCLMYAGRGDGQRPRYGARVSGLWVSALEAADRVARRYGVRAGGDAVFERANEIAEEADRAQRSFDEPEGRGGARSRRDAHA